MLIGRIPSGSCRVKKQKKSIELCDGILEVAVGQLQPYSFVIWIAIELILNISEHSLSVFHLCRTKVCLLELGCIV